MDDSGDEEEEEKEGVAMEEIISDKMGPLWTANEDVGVGVQDTDKSLVSTSAISPNATPTLNMDTDVEREEEKENRAPPAATPNLITDQQTDCIAPLGSFHMDSETDVDEDNENEVQGCLSSAAAKPSHDCQAVKAEDIYMDSDTDAEDDAVKKGAPEVSQSAHTGTTAASDFHLDSETDVDDEPEKEVNQTPSRSDIKAVDKPSLTAPPCLQTDSETDDEAAPFVSNPKVCDQKVSAEEDPPRVSPIAVTALSPVPAALSGSEVDTDVDEFPGSPDKNRVYPADLHMDSDTDVEDEGGISVAAEEQVPTLCRTKTPGFQDPPPQKCSTPMYLTGK